MKTKNIEYITIGDLIKNLTKLKDQCGEDTAVVIEGKAIFHCIEKPYYYDGGFYVKSLEKDEWLYCRDGFGRREGIPLTYIEFRADMLNSDFENLDE